MNKKQWRIAILSPIFIGAAFLLGDKGVSAFTQNYHLGIDLQNITCLPWTVFLHSKEPWKDEIERGDIVSFPSEGLEPHFMDGWRITKFVAGLPGDQIKVRDHKVYINGVFWDHLWLTDYLKTSAGEFDRVDVVPENHVLLMAVAPGSYDGRYWGFLPKEKINGYVRPII